MANQGKQDVSKAKILQLPLTQDGYVRHSLSLSYEYYGALMAGGGGGR